MSAPADPKPRLLPIRFLLQFTAVTLIWGSTWMVIRGQLGVVPPTWSVSYRFLVAGLVMMLVCLVMRRRLKQPLAAHGFFLAMAVCQFMLNFNFVYRAEAYVTSGLVAVAFALLVVPNAALAWIFLKQRITLRFAWGAMLGIVGVGLLFAQEFGSVGHGAGIGLALTLLGVVAASVGNVLQASARGRSLDIMVTLAWAMSYGALGNAAYAWVTSGAPVIELTPVYLGGLLYLGVVASALAFTIYYDMIRAVGPARAAYSSVVVPFVAMGLSTLFEGYRWTTLGFVGVALAVAGLYIALRARSAPKPA